MNFSFFFCSWMFFLVEELDVGQILLDSIVGGFSVEILQAANKKSW